MPRSTFTHDLDGVLENIQLLHARVDKAIEDSMEALLKRDLTLARSVAEGDSVINEQRYEIEEAVINLIALQAPVAGDLRELIALLFIGSNLERIGDHADGIARIALFLKDDPVAATEPYLWKMADQARAMLRSSVQAFMDRDEELARRTCDLDDEVDALYEQVHRRLVTRLAGLPHDAAEFDAVTHVLWCSHNIERIADRSTNVCERAIFLVTGKLEEINVSTF